VDHHNISQNLKGTVGPVGPVGLCEPPSKKGNARFTIVPFKPSSKQKSLLYFHIFNFGFSIKLLADLCFRINELNFKNSALFIRVKNYFIFA